MRIFVFASARSTKAVAVLDCEGLTAREAKVPGHIGLDSIQPGMVIRPANKQGRRPDISRAYVVANVDQRKGGTSIIRFESASAISKEADEPEGSDK